MYDLAQTVTPERIESLSRRAFRLLRRAGVTAVGEFHYLHHQPNGEPYAQRTELSDRVISAALSEEINITLLRVAYARAGAGRPPEGAQLRFCDTDVETVLRDVDTLTKRWAGETRVKIGIAPHSVRAVSGEWLRELHAYARRAHMPFHMHVAEVSREVEECLAETSLRPVEYLSELGVIDENFTAVHATVLEAHEARLLGEARAFVCACPTTERDLGDGLAPLGELRAAGARLCVGVDSHVVTEPLEELRALETHERLRLKRRVTFTPPEGRTVAEQLLLEGSLHGALSIGHPVTLSANTYDGWDARTVVDLEHPALEGVLSENTLDAWVFSGNTTEGITVAQVGPGGVTVR